ncbi:hypothetical protein BA917_09040 [Helicobacter pullorum]|uniref:hypothetical protein n=1 Tax=Helicobacter pullorum TaxID=35818 RepID=UPI000816A34F|nr:hypothetical protein [Helicobacter pullorum]OCR18228.1 hypothetical protein BA917_09040 [Helicobacter pullorum]
MEMTEEIKQAREGMNFSEDGKKCPLCGGGIGVGRERATQKETHLRCSNPDCEFILWYGTIGKKDIFGMPLARKEYLTLLKGKSIKNKAGDLVWLVNDKSMGYKKVQFAPKKDLELL